MLVRFSGSILLLESYKFLEARNTRFMKPLRSLRLCESYFLVRDFGLSRKGAKNAEGKRLMRNFFYGNT